MLLLLAYGLVTFVAYPIHLAARPGGGVGLTHDPFLRVATSAAFLGLLVAVFTVSWGASVGRLVHSHDP